MRIAIIYATREGQTRRIVEHLAGLLRTHAVDVELFDARDEAEPELDAYDALVVAGSVHVGAHERELVAFVKRHREALQRVPTAFLSVSLSQAGVEDARRTPEQRARAEKNVAATLETFFRKTGWRPRWTQPVAGALLYTRYGFVIRRVMKWISQHEGGSVDTSRDHEYTDWQALEYFAGQLVGQASASERQPAAVT